MVRGCNSKSKKTELWIADVVSSRPHTTWLLLFRRRFCPNEGCAFFEREKQKSFTYRTERDLYAPACACLVVVVANENQEKLFRICNRSKKERRKLFFRSNWPSFQVIIGKRTKSKKMKKQRKIKTQWPYRLVPETN